MSPFLPEKYSLRSFLPEKTLPSSFLPEKTLPSSSLPSSYLDELRFAEQLPLAEQFPPCRAAPTLPSSSDLTEPSLPNTSEQITTNSSTPERGFGASGGIGVETARTLALRGIHVIMAVRNVSSGEKVKGTILKDLSSAKIDVMELDLSSMESVRKFVSEFNSRKIPLNLLINNAGIMAIPFALSKDGIEMQFATNYIGHFLLTHLLLENMKRTSRDSKIEGRIVNVSSLGHTFAYKEGIRFEKINNQSEYTKYGAYGQSKVANILHTNELSRRFKEDGVNITANSLHPGSIATNLMNHDFFMRLANNPVTRLFLKNVQQGAATSCYVALHPGVKGVSGKYFSDSNIANPSALAKNDELAKKLWEFTMQLIK